MNEPQRFRKRPVEVEAVQWDGTAEAAGPVINWVLDTGTRSARYLDPVPELRNNRGDIERKALPARLSIETLEGTMHAVADDWIIRGVAGEHYPCKPAIFESTYEPVETTTDA